MSKHEDISASTNSSQPVVLVYVDPTAALPRYVMMIDGCPVSGCQRIISTSTLG